MHILLRRFTVQYYNRQPRSPLAQHRLEAVPHLAAHTATLYEANALACARQLIGDAAEHMYSHAIRKPERMGAATPWHQDEAYAPPELDYGRGGGFNVVNSWMPLQPCDADSGCMQ